MSGVAGDVIYLKLDPTKGSEQAKTRPCLIISEPFHPTLSIVVPLTTRPPRIPVYHYEMETPSDEADRWTSTALCDQVRTLDVMARYDPRRRHDEWSVTLTDLYAVRRIVASIIGIR